MGGPKLSSRRSMGHTNWVQIEKRKPEVAAEFRLKGGGRLSAADELLASCG